MRIKYKMTGHERDVSDAIGQQLISRKLAFAIGGAIPATAEKPARKPRKAKDPDKPKRTRTRAVKAEGESTTPNTYQRRDLRAED